MPENEREEVRKIARAYYASKISTNKARTPEGYLICYNSAIGRTGWQEYMPKELGLQGNIPVQLYRGEEEVFCPASIASFEGKPITDEHPQNWVSPENINSYMRGVTTNVRRGIDADSDLLLADLIIYDPVIISGIEAGKRELSGGYDYDCVPLAEEGRYAQTNIRGNHVAIVREGRAGYRVAVKDSKPQKERGKPKMINKETIWGKMFKAFAVDADPEELAAASKMMHKDEKEGTDADPAVEPVAAKAVTPKAADAEPVVDATAIMLKQVLEKLTGIEGRISALEQAEKAEVAPKDALDELETELTNGEGMPEGQELGNEEGAVTIDPETLQDAAPVSDPSDRPVNTIQGADSRTAVMMALKVARPIVNAIKDPVERKKAQDSMASEFRKQLSVTPNKTNAYAAMTQPAKAKDAVKEDDSQIGINLKNKFNPHYKNKK
jgi:hypothetical protein